MAGVGSLHSLFSYLFGWLLSRQEHSTIRTIRKSSQPLILLRGTRHGFLYLIPVVAFLVTWAWLGEVPPGLSVIGDVIALAGVLLVNRRMR